MRTKLFPVILTAALTSAGTMFLAAKFNTSVPYFAEARQQMPVNYVSNNGPAGAPADFQLAAEASTKAAVHIKTKINARQVTAYDPNDFFSQFFGPQQYQIPPQMGSGSGVVISPDGYIVTNNHVVAGADEVTVTFNDRRTTDAKVIATDPSTDIAVLKVTETGLPYMEFGNSDDVKVGQWVLAAGYPLTLDATVTAGIVSAKGRSIGINRKQSEAAIEAFIQTDAAVNPGNSGGALVNTSGQLIGINSAIASPTGSYAGYSYAIPSNLVRKVVNDLVQYGTLQRGYLGVEYLDVERMSPEQLKQAGIDRMDGIYVKGVKSNSGAADAGIAVGDYITHVNGKMVRTEPELQEQIARFKPGDKVSVTYVRGTTTKVADVQLKSMENTTGVVKKSEPTAASLGAKLRTLSNDEAKKYNVESGVEVSELSNGTLARANIKKGFVITSVNDKPVKSADDVKSLIGNSRNVQIGGFYPGRNGMYYYGLNGAFDDGNK
jgi:serine protease Do